MISRLKDLQRLRELAADLPVAQSSLLDGEVRVDLDDGEAHEELGVLKRAVERCRRE